MNVKELKEELEKVPEYLPVNVVIDYPDKPTYIQELKEVQVTQPFNYKIVCVLYGTED